MTDSYTVYGFILKEDIIEQIMAHIQNDPTRNFILENPFDIETYLERRIQNINQFIGFIRISIYVHRQNKLRYL